MDIAHIFDNARTYNGFTDRPVPEALLKELYDRLKWGPTSANSSPARFVFVASKQGKERLLPCVNEGNLEKVKSAPVTAIVAADTLFYEQMPTLFPGRDFKSAFEGNTAVVEDLLLRNVPLQGAYMIIAARALGLDCGPMSGFDKGKVDAEFFPDGQWKSNFICNLGYGDPDKLWDRNPRLSFDEACRIV